MKENRIDKFIEDLAGRFSKIPNFHLTQEDEKGIILFNFITKRFSELQAFRDLITTYYLPAASKSTIDGLNEIKKSKYRKLIKLTQEDLRENYNETIRLGYIGVFHKFESFMRDLVINAETLISGIETNNNSLEKYVKEKFDFRIVDWKNYPTVIRINWICNCIKHYDGLPIKEPIPKTYRHLDKNKRMVFSREEFIKDIDKLVEQNISILQLTFMFATYKMAFDSKDYETDSNNNSDFSKKIADGKTKLDETLKKLIQLNKELADME